MSLALWRKSGSVFVKRFLFDNILDRTKTLWFTVAFNEATNMGNMKFIPTYMHNRIIIYLIYLSMLAPSRNLFLLTGGITCIMAQINSYVHTSDSLSMNMDDCHYY